MRAALLILALTFSLAACAKNPEDQRRADARDVASVEATQNRLPPIQSVALEALLPNDQMRIDEVGGRCVYALERAARAETVLVTMGSFGWIKIKSELIKLSGDIGAEPGPARTWSHYTGREISLRILPDGSAARPADSVQAQRPVRLVVRDAWDRPVFEANLTRTCSA